MSDITPEIQNIQNAVKHAYASKTSLFICGGQSKLNIIGRDCSADILDVSPNTGIVDYQPTELVITARAGTTVSEIAATLATENQFLSFEPPQFDGKATLGGTLACNLSGPARPWGGSIRDMVLGVQLINGKAQHLNFGGQVMKNVAGYDVSRLQAGALGTLGVLTQISLKVLPKPEYTLTLSYELDAQTAVQQMNSRAVEPKPLNGAFWVDGRLFLRLSGTENAVRHTASTWGGEHVSNADAVWQALREMTHPFFSGDDALWRISQGPTAMVKAHFGETLIDWGGAQRWIRGNHDWRAVETLAEHTGGHASLFRGGDRQGEVKHSANSIEKRLHQRLKHAFDPEGILNPGRMYSWM